MPHSSKGWNTKQLSWFFFSELRKKNYSANLRAVKSTLAQNEDWVLIQQIAAYNSWLTAASLNQKKSLLSIGQIFPSAKYVLIIYRSGSQTFQAKYHFSSTHICSAKTNVWIRLLVLFIQHVLCSVKASDCASPLIVLALNSRTSNWSCLNCSPKEPLRDLTRLFCGPGS